MLSFSMPVQTTSRAKNFLLNSCISSIVDATAVYPNVIKTLFANGLITFFISDKPTLNNDKSVFTDHSLITAV